MKRPSSHIRNSVEEKMTTCPTVDRKYRLESFLAMNSAPEPAKSRTNTTAAVDPLNPTEPAKLSTTTTPTKPLNPTQPLSPTESSKDENQSDVDHKPAVTLVYAICWLLVLPVAMCVGFLASPRHKKSKKTTNDPLDLEKQDVGPDAAGKASLNLEPVALRAGIKLDALPEAEEGRHAGSKEVLEMEKN